MKNFLVIALVAFGVFIVTSCDEQTPTDNDVNPTSTKSMLKGSPAESGIVVRYQGSAVVFWSDAKSGLVVGIGAQDFSGAICGAAESDILNVQDVFSPSNEDGGRIIEKVTGNNVSVSVWEIGDYPNDLCSFFSNEPIATGNVKFQYNDNDLLANGEHNINSYSLHVVGNVMGSDGQNYNLNAFNHGVWYDGDFSTLKVLKRTIQLTPKGN